MLVAYSIFTIQIDIGSPDKKLNKFSEAISTGQMQSSAPILDSGSTRRVTLMHINIHTCYRTHTFEAHYIIFFIDVDGEMLDQELNDIFFVMSGGKVENGVSLLYKGDKTEIQP